MCTQLMVARTAIGAIDPAGDAQSYGNEAEVPVAIQRRYPELDALLRSFFLDFSRAGKRIRPKGTKVFGEGCIG